MKLIRLFQRERRRVSVPVSVERRSDGRAKQHEQTKAEQQAVREDLRRLQYELDLLQRGR